jgi:hypothetical protein
MVLITRFAAALYLAPLLSGGQVNLHSLHHSPSMMVVGNSENLSPRDKTATPPTCEGCEGQPSSPATDTGKPTVHGPVTPGVQQNDLTRSPTVEPWKPGEPVRVRPDLKKSDDNHTR